MRILIKQSKVILLIALLISCTNTKQRMPASLTSTASQPCKELFKSLIKPSSNNTDYLSFKRTLQSLESISSNENFNPLDGVSGISEKKLFWKRSVKNSLNKLSRSEPISAREAQQLTIHLYKLSHPQPLLKTLSSKFVYLENSDELIKRRIFEEISSRNVVEALESLGLLRRSSDIDRFKNLISKEKNKINSAISLAYNAVIMSFSNYLLLIPNLQSTRNLDIPNNLVDRIMDNGVDSLLPELKAKYGSKANFEVNWQRFRYGANSLMMLYLIYSLPDHIEKIQEEMQNLVVQQMSESITESVNIDENEIKAEKYLKEYADLMFSKYKREPTSEELEEARILYLYFSGSTSI